MRRHLTGKVAWLTAITVVVGGMLAANASAEPSMGPLPVQFDFRDAVLGLLAPETPPPGANDWNCLPTPEHPHPVVLVNGTGLGMGNDWRAGAPFLKNNGFCVYTFNTGTPSWLPNGTPVYTLGDVTEQARDLAIMVDRVRAATGAAKVDVVGHSSGGGLVSLYYLNRLDGTEFVDKMIGISPSNHGTSLSTIVSLGRSLAPGAYNALGAAFPSLTQQALDSDIVEEIYGAGDTRPGVTYTTIVTRYDQTVTPYENQYLDGPRVTNITLQDGCPIDRSEHLSTLYNERVWRHVLNALDPDHPAPVPCIPVDPYWPGIR
ncbi:alpha/beta fold hydrolase [Nocardia sp. NPDC052316]|uniref:alpha/beta fold hydrolase n=1 Tax=Nocardia sp. NPDC052316 TaxID=3364329 RepID=UPI0037C55C80